MAGSGLLVGDTRDCSSVYTMHGGVGEAGWKLLARRSQMVSSWEAFEWSSLGPGAVSGEHSNSRTEALYFVVSGSAEILLNGMPCSVAAGDLILTSVGATHGLRNTSRRSSVEWLMIEMLSPTTAALLEIGSSTLMKEPTTTGGVDMSTIGRGAVFDLRDPGEVDPRSVLDGPLRRVRRVRLDPGESIRLEANEAEYATFTLSGSGRVRSGSTMITLSAGTAVTLPLGTSAEFVADHATVELFVATMAVTRLGAEA